MKKLLLSLALILTFGAYAFHQKTDNEQAIPLIPSQSLSQGTEEGTNPQSQTNTPPAQTTSASFKDGSYTGPVTDAFYGNIQVQTTISGGKITNLVFLDYPKDRSESEEINSQAMPLLKQEAISAQNANVDIVSGATQTSEAFKQSLASALSKAQ
jgi:uncharacterized protein with FMN-binding domain